MVRLHPRPVISLGLLATPSAAEAQPGGTKRVPAATATAKEARTLLETQAAAWNRGDLEAFCSVYADDALFVTAFGVTKGRAEVLARYEARYPDAAARGTLSFEMLSVDVLAPGAVEEGRARRSPSSPAGRSPTPTSPPPRASRSSTS